MVVAALSCNTITSRKMNKNARLTIIPAAVAVVALSGCAQTQQLPPSEEFQLSYANYKATSCRIDLDTIRFETNCSEAYAGMLRGYLAQHPDKQEMVTKLALEAQKTRDSNIAKAQEASPEAQAARARAQAAQVQAEQVQAEKAKQATQAALARHIADMKAGRAKPQTIREAAAVYGAQNGQGLIENPALRPDGKTYAMVGIIDPQSDAAHGVLIIRGVQMNMLAGNKYGNTVGYAMIKFKNVNAIPANAHIGDQLEIVGHYAANRSYTTLVGQQKAMPVLDAEWSKAGPSIF
ncbi:hypothetical protein ACT2E5_16310 [Burkholderia vietnamiensis]|uniref:hypothetical protein n=1 Tax=Burkholderia vietnamiensis TaxID=60552 RepID=UPI00402AB785